MDKPLLKNAWHYFRDDNNWIIKWSDPKTGLVISKLGHIPLLRLTLWDHNINDYVHYDISPIVYFPNCHEVHDIHQNPCFTSMSEREIKDMIKYKWEDEE